MRSRRAIAAIAALALGAGAVVIPSAAEAGRSKVKTITVGDNYFSLQRLTIKKGQQIKWLWSRANSNSHNVTLLSGPKGVSPVKFTSATGAVGVRFERVFLKPGKYQFECTIHPWMRTTVTVKR